MDIPKGWHIEYSPKPIPPSCGVDFDFWHDDNDIENNLSGTGSSIEDCLNQINEIEEE